MIPDDWRRYLAPAAFLLAATIAVVLIRSGIESGGGQARATAGAPTPGGTSWSPRRPPGDRRTKRFWIVRAGDTFAVISSKSGVPVATLVRLNPKVHSTSLFIGERIRLSEAPARVAVLAGGVLAAGDRACGAPPVRAAAYLVEDARTGEILASSNAHAERPIASMTKLMTVLLTLQHHKLTDVVTVDPRAAAVGESSIELDGGEQMTVEDLLKGTLIQSANDAADALALSIAPDFPSFARLMNAEAVKLGLRDTHFVRPDGLDAPGEYSSAADITRLARLAMHTRFVRDTVRQETATISGGRTLHTWDDLLSEFPQTIGVKTGHTDLAGWCQVAAARGRGVTIYATLLGSPTRARAQRRPRVAARLGPRPVPPRRRDRVRAVTTRRCGSPMAALRSTSSLRSRCSPSSASAGR